MKVVLALLALVPVVMGQDPNRFVLNNPKPSLADETRPIITVAYENTRLDEPNHDPIVEGTTVQGYAPTCEGHYPDASAISGLIIPGITDNYDPATSVSSSPKSFSTTYEVTVDPTLVPAAIYNEDETNVATITFCMITGLEAVGGPLVDFTETEVILKFNLIDDSITSFLWKAVTAAANTFTPNPIAIDTITQACLSPNLPDSPGGTVNQQGEQVCFEVCVNEQNTVIGTTSDWEVTDLTNVQAAGLVGTSIETQDLDKDDVLVTWFSQIGKCFKVSFYPNAAYYTSDGNWVTITGGAKMSRFIPTRHLRQTRELEGLEAAEGEFELQMELLGVEDDSAAISIKQITFAAGIAGVALMV